MADAGPDLLLSAPTGVAHNAATDNTIAGTVEAAMAAGMAHVMYIEQDISPQGSAAGELMPLPMAETPFHDTSVLGGEPPPLQGGAS
jgi:hypothetical protein